MSTYNYTYTVARVDTDTNTMEVVFEAPGKPAITVGARLPFKGENLDLMLEQYAPTNYWDSLSAEYEPPVVGLQGGSGAGAVFQAMGAEFSSGLHTVQDVRERKLRDIANWRYSREVSGVLLGGAPIKTDRESQAAVNNAYTSLKNGLLTSVNWKAADGSWVVLTLTEVEAIAAAVARHVKDCFDAEMHLGQQLEAALAGVTDVPAAVLAAESVVLA